MTRKKDDYYKDEPVFQHDFFDTTGMSDFTLKIKGKAPKGYPSEWTCDTYTDSPFKKTFRERKDVFIKHCLKNPAPDSIKGYYYELIRLRKNRGPVHESLIEGVLDYIDERYDCSDFVMLGIVRLLYQFKENRLLSKKLIKKAESTLLNFKYWPDEPGIDSMCYWTENHQIMFSCNEYLAGQLFPDSIFQNSGMTGFQKMERARKRILQWLELRYKTGFSEWLSHIYYDEDLTALINLVDFCSDPIIVKRALIVLDLMFLDMALNSYEGIFGSTHGRSYGAEKQNALVESTSDTQKLFFGMGIFSGADNMSAVSFALSGNYRLPKVIFDIAVDTVKEMENKQRMSINIVESKKWGLDPEKPADMMTLLSLEAYSHRKTFKGFINLLDIYRWWENQFFIEFANKKWLVKLLLKTGLYRIAARYFEKDMTRNTREEVNTYSYRTKDYMISSAQDYRKGYGGDQQHIWQATLSPKTVCFTTHPGHREDSSAGYWVGSGTLPRVGQVKNVLMAVYKVSKKKGIYMTNELFFTHAFFPRHEFDIVDEYGGWIFGKKENAYLALRSQNEYRWQNSGEYKDKEIIAEGLNNIWICEMGNKAQYKSFENFKDKISSAQLQFKRDTVTYESPSLGVISFGWKGHLKLNGKIQNIKNYGRYENRYVKATFPPEDIDVIRKKETLKLNFEKGIRESTAFCEQ